MANKVVIPAQFEQIQPVCEWLGEAAAAVGFGPDEVFKLQLACDEACTNIIEHAYGSSGAAEGEIQVAHAVEGERFVVTIRDHGRAFDPAAVPKPNLPSSPNDAEELPVGGLGLHIMRQIMDDVQFEFDEAAGNRLRMTKRLPER